MKTLEIVHLRSSGEPLGPLSHRIRESIKTEREHTEAVTLYCRHGLDTDLAVHINRSGVARRQEPSRLAVQLAAALRAYGLVEHSRWEELR